MKSNSAFDRSDEMWSVLIRLALFHRARIGHTHNIGWERQSYYIVETLPKLAAMLVEEGAIIQWDAGFRRFRTIQEGAAADFLAAWRKYPKDQ